jgi:hypothetical protein
MMTIRYRFRAAASWVLATMMLTMSGRVAAGDTPPVAAQAPGTADLARIVRALSGTWAITGRSLATHGAADSTVAHGEETWQTGTGGLTFSENYRARIRDQDTYDSAVIWWDGKARGIRGLWCADINDEGCNGFTVRLEGEAIVMEGEWEMSGRRSGWKEVFTMAGPDSFTQVLSFGPPGGAMTPGTEIGARRVQPNRWSR